MALEWLTDTDIERLELLNRRAHFLRLGLTQLAHERDHLITDDPEPRPDPPYNPRAGMGVAANKSKTNRLKQ